MNLTSNTGGYKCADLTGILGWRIQTVTKTRWINCSRLLRVWTFVQEWLHNAGKAVLGASLAWSMRIAGFGFIYNLSFWKIWIVRDVQNVISNHAGVSREFPCDFGKVWHLVWMSAILGNIQGAQPILTKSSTSCQRSFLKLSLTIYGLFWSAFVT